MFLYILVIFKYFLKQNKYCLIIILKWQGDLGNRFSNSFSLGVMKIIWLVKLLLEKQKKLKHMKKDYNKKLLILIKYSINFSKSTINSLKSWNKNRNNSSRSIILTSMVKSLILIRYSKSIKMPQWNKFNKPIELMLLNIIQKWMKVHKPNKNSMIYQEHTIN